MGDSEVERVAFEKFYWKGTVCPPASKRDDGGYVEFGAFMAWESWKARAAISALRPATRPQPVVDQCSHEAYQGQCVHCNAPYVGGRVMVRPIRPALDIEAVIGEMEALKYKGELNEAQEAENLAVDECIALLRNAARSGGGE